MDDLFGTYDDDADAEAAAVPRSKNCGVLKWHSPAAEEGLFVHLERHAQQCRGNPAETLRHVDIYATTKHWLMCIGPEKAQILEREALKPIVEARAAASSGAAPSQCLVVAELGSYLGYSAVFLANTLLRLGVQRANLNVVSLEGDPLCVSWTRRMVDFCGCSDVVTVLHSTGAHAAALSRHLEASLTPNPNPNPNSDSNSSTTPNPTPAPAPAPTLDLLLIDHDTALYTSDLAAIESAGLLRPGSYVCADNVLSFRKPLTEYLDHVRDTHRYASSRLFMSRIEYPDEPTNGAVGVEGEGDDVDGMEISVYL